MADTIKMSDEKLSDFAFGGINLSLGAGLPGTRGLNLKAILEKLYHWAKLVRDHTNDWLSCYHRNPQAFDCSPGRLCMMCLVSVLQRDLGVRYSPAYMEGDYDASDARAIFVHGLLTGYGGTCASMPMLYIAVGRALGYPLKLMMAKEHLFARWEEPGGERFNIECTSVGFVSHEDEYYYLGNQVTQQSRVVERSPDCFTPGDSRVFVAEVIPLESAAD